MIAGVHFHMLIFYYIFDAFLLYLATGKPGIILIGVIVHSWRWQISKDTGDYEIVAEQLL